MKKTVALLLLAVLMLSLVACGAGETRDVSEYRTTMEFHEDFRILQLADLHFGIETDHEEKLDLIRERIRREEPDLIILTGDNFMYASEGTVRTLIEVLNEECRLLSESRPERLTKFAMTFGNHDNQGTYDGYLINRVLLSFVAPDGQERAQGKYAAFLDVEGDSVYAEFYADNIRRFGVDTEYDLNALPNLPDGISYEGGAIGYNCFNAKVRFEETHYAESDYTYYTEAYRQQYHFFLQSYG